MELPEDLRYSKEHAWVRVGGAESVLGITDHAQRELGDVVFVELPQPGARLSRGRPYGTVESVKAVSDLIAPLDGTVVRANEELAATPELLNSDPYGRGWTVAVAPAGPAGEGDLLDEAAYRAFVEQLAPKG